MKFIFNNIYSYEEIYTFAYDNNSCLEEYGKFIIGERFICITNDKHTYSFILVSYNDKTGAFYKCIFLYNDKK